MPTKKNKREWNTIWISTIRNAPQKFSRESDKHIQGTFQVHFMWDGKIVPTNPVGQAHPTNIYASERTTAGKRHTKIIIICVTQCTTRFQLHANSTIGLRRPNSQKYRPQSIIGTPINQWVRPGNFHHALLLLQCMEQRKRCQNSIKHILLLTQVHKKSNSDTWRCGRTGSATTNSGDQRKIKDSYGRKCNGPTQQIGCNLQHNLRGRKPRHQLRWCRNNQPNLLGWSWKN